MGDTSQVIHIKAVDFQKFLDEVRAIKSRALNADLTRFEEQRRVAIDTALDAARKRARSGTGEEILRLQQETRKLVEAEQEQSKQLLMAKYSKFDATLLAASQQLKDLLLLRDLSGSLKADEERIRKMDDELTVRRKVLEREHEDLGREKARITATREEAEALKTDAASRIANLDVVERAKELDRLRSELENKVKAYETEAERIARQRDELNRDFEKLGEKRVELDREGEALQKDREKLLDEKKRINAVVAREIGTALEGFVRDLLNGRKEEEE